MTDLDRLLADARRNLLDLTLRNRLINHRRSLKRSLGIVDELPDEIYHRLVLEEKAMWFRPASEEQADAAETAPVSGEPPVPVEEAGAETAESPASGEAASGAENDSRGEPPEGAPVPESAPATDGSGDRAEPVPPAGAADTSVPVTSGDPGEDRTVAAATQHGPDQMSRDPGVSSPGLAAEPPSAALESALGSPARSGTVPEPGSSVPPTPDPETESDGADPLWTLDEPDEPVAERHRDRYLQTDVKAGGLQQRLFYIHQQARSVLEEQGYTVLYLALGFLVWRDDDREPLRRAPLLLIPVDLERPRVGSAFKVRWTREEMQTNISLEARLSELGVALPTFEMPEAKEGISDYLAAVSRAVSARPDWEVAPEIVLDFFSFTKFVMYRDLDPTTWPRHRSPAEHDLLRTILAPGEPSAEDDPPETAFQEDVVDQTLDARKVYHVMDADPSQIAVIEDVKAGHNLVVEGPPGTGKSQTITNVIAELLASGKSVLFVSEKMAALEVVKRRLDQAGLGAYCLELHSRKSRKREVLEELKRTLAAPRAKDVSFEAEFEKLDHLRGDLNGYAAALAEPVGASDLSPFQLFGRVDEARAHFENHDRQMPRVALTGVASVEPRELAAVRAQLESLADTLELVHPVCDHPWRGCRPGTVLPADEEAILRALEALLHALEALEARAGELASLSAQRGPERPSDLAPTLDAARLLLDPGPVARENLLDARWDGDNPEADRALDRVNAYHHRRTQVLGRFHPDVLEQDVGRMLEDYQRLAPGLFRFLSGRYRALKRQIVALYRVRPPRDRLEWSLDLENARKAVALREEVREVEAIGRDCFGPAWQGEESDPESLRQVKAWLVAFRGHVRAGRFSGATADLVETGVDRAALAAAVRALEEAEPTFRAARQALAGHVGLEWSVVFEREPDEVAFVDLAARLRLWRDEIKSLQAWSRFRAVADQSQDTVAGPLVAYAQSDGLPPEDLLAAWDGNVAEALLREAFSSRPALAHFVGALHEKKIASFRELDLALIRANRRRLGALLSRRRPAIAGGASPTSEAGVLLGEFNRKRGHMPIRQLMKRAGALIQRIKPCFMMSPLSIAQFLAPENARFDVVVFDEASQVRPEDALGALLRGAQVVVMGDTRQLPPTSFFDHLLEEMPGDEDPAERAASLTDIESILHQCRRSFPARTLRWHYRSRHESLIAVSNEVFYGSRLRIYPSPFHRAPDLGLQFRHVPDAPYDRGRTGSNREEARVVARAALEHMERHPELSLGIGAFNVRQQQAVLEEVERLLRRHPELEPRFTAGPEPFFVKNLETIQGDERDVMFLSIGFGFDASGKLYRNFGPLNQEGGERRLNVLITRARRRCVVFANFRGEDLRVDETTPPGVRALRDYLVFAETRNDTPGAAGSPAVPVSRFEQIVADWLTERGQPVRARVGCAGFRVDLAVVDEADPGRYRLGIECDAEKYHTATMARDRDRLRSQILENLGWPLVRIWSTDWYRNRAEAEARLGEAVDAVLAWPAHEETGLQPADRPDPDGGSGREPTTGPTAEPDPKPEPEDPSAEAREPAPPVNQTARAVGESGEGDESDATDVPDGGVPDDPEVSNAPSPAASAPARPVASSSAPTGLAVFQPADPLEQGVPDYVVCEDLRGVAVAGELTGQSTEILARAVAAVVEVEGPVHVEEVVRRIRTLWGLKRAGERVVQALEAAMEHAAVQGHVRREGLFLFSPSRDEVPIRRRGPEAPRKMEHVADGELEAAVRRVLEVQYATPPRDLVNRTARLLGFPVTTASIRARLSTVVERLVARGDLERRPGGTVDLKGRP